MVRWGIVATGRIASQFVDALRVVDDAEVVAVSSRTQERADSFADEHGIAGRYTSVEALANDDLVDVVYVATPHSGHEADTLAALRGGKHVLCEKPMSLNATQTQRMVDESRVQGRFLMEAIWSRFLPGYVELRRLLDDGVIGEPQVVEASFGFAAAFDPAHRLFAPELGGGGLLDLGIYPVQLCTFVLGLPDTVVAQGVLGGTGVDEIAAGVLRTARGGIGVVQCATRANLPSTARIAGTRGSVDLPAFMHCPTHLTVTAAGESRRIDTPFVHGLHYQALEVHRCIEAGLIESPVVSGDESVALARILDDMRAQIGVVYPGE